MDAYEIPISLSLSDSALDKVTGQLADEITSMGEISEKFADNAYEMAKKYNAEIEKQERLIEDMNKRLSGGNLSGAQKAIYEGILKKAQETYNSYKFGNAEKKLASQEEVNALADATAGSRSKKKDPTLQKMTNALSTATGKVAGFAGAVEGAGRAAISFVKKIMESLDEMAAVANQLNPLGAFGDSGQRDIMTRYGLSGSQAMGFSQALDAMHMSETDIGRMTPAQQKAFKELTGYWDELMSKMDPDALQRYTELMEQYQMVVAKFNMGLQAVILKLVSSSPTFSKMVGRLEELLDHTLDFLNSPVVQAVFDGLMGALDAVVWFLDKIMQVATVIGGGSLGSTTNNNSSSTANNTFNVYGSNYQDNSELARQISYAVTSTFKG